MALIKHAEKTLTENTLMIAEQEKLINDLTSENEQLYDDIRVMQLEHGTRHLLFYGVQQIQAPGFVEDTERVLKHFLSRTLAADHRNIECIPFETVQRLPRKYPGLGESHRNGRCLPKCIIAVFVNKQDREAILRSFDDLRSARRGKRN
jgi:hypothetical protein